MSQGWLGALKSVRKFKNLVEVRIEHPHGRVWVVSTKEDVSELPRAIAAASQSALLVMELAPLASQLAPLVKVT